MNTNHCVPESVQSSLNRANDLVIKKDQEFLKPYSTVQEIEEQNMWFP